MIVQADVASDEAVGAMVKDTMDAFGQIDILVNNAGITRDNLLMRMKEGDWDAVMNTNLKGCVCLYESGVSCYDETKVWQVY